MANKKDKPPKSAKAEAKAAAKAEKKAKRKAAALGLDGWAWRLGVSGVGGCMVFLAFPNFNLFFLAWFALVPTLWAARGTTARQHFLIGLWAGAITNLGGFYWIGGMLIDFGHMNLVLASALTVLTTTYQGLVVAFWLLLLHKMRTWAKVGNWLLGPIVFVAIEYLLWNIFPWYYANSQYNWIPAIQIVELGGVSLLTFLLVMVNCAIFDAWEAWRSGAGRHRVLLFLSLAASVVALNAGYGLIRMSMVDAAAEAAPKLRIGLVEADVGIFEKEEPGKVRNNLVQHQRMSVELAKQGVDLIVWPETSYHAPRSYARRAGESNFSGFRPIPRDAAAIQSSKTVPPADARQDTLDNVPREDRYAPQRGFSTPLLFGALTFRKNPESPSVRHPGVDYLNSAILLDEQGKVLGIYDKVYLLVFGEHIPFGDLFPIFYRWLPEAGDLVAGSDVTVLPFGEYKIGIMVCYEDILPAFGRKLIALEPNVLINVTNDAWFGKTSEPYLHLALAIFRAVEARVPLIRSTNTGVSCFIDANGRITSETSIEGAETLLESVPMMDGGSVYAVLGDWPAWASLLVIPLLWGLARRRRKA